MKFRPEVLPEVRLKEMDNEFVTKSPKFSFEIRKTVITIKLIDDQKKMRDILNFFFYGLIFNRQINRPYLM